MLHKPHWNFSVSTPWGSVNLVRIESSSSLRGLSEPLWSFEEVSESDEGYPEIGERSLGSGERGRLLVVHTVIGLYAPGLRISAWGMRGKGIAL